MNRITEKMLQAKVDYLNKITGNPDAPYAKTEAGLKANIGNYHISGAYGGVCLHQMVNEGGGVRTPLQAGHVPKRELFDGLCAFIKGIEIGKTS